LEEIMRTIHMQSAHVLRLCREKIAQVVAEHTDQGVSQVMDSLARLFRLDKTMIFKELIGPLFITLVLRGNQESHLHIRHLVNEVPYCSSTQDYISKIVQLCVIPETLVHIFTRTSKEEQDVHFAFLESHLSMSIARIARLNDVSRLMHQFVLRLYPFRVGASHGLRWIASQVLTRSESPPGTTVSFGTTKGPAAADFLGHYVCGILAFFDNTLLDDDTMLEHRWIALRSLVVFIQLLGSGHVTRMRAKFMATLKLETDALCELLPDLGATLVSLLPYGSDQVTDLFHYLFLEKKDQLNDRLGALFFLPRIPQLLTCQQILDDICTWRSLSTFDLSSLSEAQLCPLLSAWLSALTHASRSVRRLALTAEQNTHNVGDSVTFTGSSRLWGLPNQVYGNAASTASVTYPMNEADALDTTRRESDVLNEQQLLPRQMSSSALLADLIAALLEGLTRDTDTEMRLLYAQWFGQLGAIDPSKLCPSVTCTVSGTQPTVIYVNDRRFPFYILCELAKIYLRAASPKQLDSTALAIQELLKLFKVPEHTKPVGALPRISSNNSMETVTADVASLPFVAGGELWILFPEHLRDLFAPLLTSRYAVEAFTDWTTVRSPLIVSDEDMTFESWIRLWAGSLSAHITSQHAFRIFQFCEPVVKTDAGFARLLLEHAALQVLLDDAQIGIQQLRTEVLAVLQEVSDSDPVEELETSSSNDLATASLGDWSLVGHALSSKHHCWKPWFPLAVQTVFGLLDHLGRWHREQQLAAASSATKPQTGAPATGAPVANKPSLSETVSPSAVKRVGAFLAQIPHQLQARASLRSGGFARSLLQWELAYDEDAVAQQSAYTTGVALIRRSAVARVTEFVSPHTSNEASGDPVGSVGPVALAAFGGLLNTYTCLRDSDGLAGVLAVSQLATGSMQLKSGEKSPPPRISAGDERFSTLRALELENEGQLDMAAASYEHNLAHWEFASNTQIASTHTLDQQDSANSHELTGSAHDQRLVLYAGLFRCELSDPARLHGLVERAGALIRRHPSGESVMKPSAALKSTQKVLPSATSAAWTRRLNAYRAEAAWRLSDWNTLRETTSLDPSASSWSVGLGKLFLAVSDQRPSDRLPMLTNLRTGLMTDLGAAALEGPGGYARAYDTIARLSTLADVELIAQLGDLVHRQLGIGFDHMINNQVFVQLQSRMDEVLALLDARIKLAQPTFHTLEPRLAAQHTGLNSIWLELQTATRSARTNSPVAGLVTRLRTALGRNWLQRAKLTRKYGQFMAAYTCVLRAEAFDVPEALIERAKLLWQTDKREAAQACLDNGIPEIYGEVVSTIAGGPGKTAQRQAQPALWAAAQQALLLRARYCEETNRFDFETTRRMYEEVCELTEGCEEAHFRLARYVDRAQSLTNNSNQHDTLLKAALKHYGLALSFGSQFIYQSMPRLLSLWLDYGTDYARHYSSTGGKVNSGSVDHRITADQRTFQEVQEIMRQNIKRVPAYQYYTALGQVLSRVCHEDPTVVNTIIDLIVRIFEAYPHQTIWFMMPLNNSAVRQRRDRCQQIFNTVNNYSRILIPIHRQLVPTLPAARSRCEDMQRHWPFGAGSDHSVYLTRMEDNVDILGSQTRPKKMTWLGSDGRRYIIVAKPNDDLRKDSRLMELNGMINKFLAKNPETRRRALQIRTYAVIPLSEKGGLIEWVSNTEPFRTIITRLYNEAGRPINWANMSRVAPLLEDPLPVKRDKYLNKWLPMFPLVFHRWFLNMFPNPSAWYSARECYARTCAVMSMVGYVLGLGDRHTENILFDSTTGGVVHVDFSCVFNNGLNLPWPERVPFRLTRNMVRALGPTGYEGIFRRCAEAVMRLLRHEVDPFLAVFRPIYFDALVEQGGGGGANGRGPAQSSDAGIVFSDSQPVNLARQ
uniref:Serine/threonine-protein kinase ATR n=1 Tax=Echinostoma caproni TaxID=27848 RepID=A0A183ABV4_9TREM